VVVLTQLFCNVKVQIFSSLTQRTAEQQTSFIHIVSHIIFAVESEVQLDSLKQEVEEQRRHEQEEASLIHSI